MHHLHPHACIFTNNEIDSEPLQNMPIYTKKYQLHILSRFITLADKKVERRKKKKNKKKKQSKNNMFPNFV